MSEGKPENTLSRLIWGLVPVIIGGCIAALLILSEEYQYSLLGNILYGCVGLLMSVFGLWKLYVLYQIYFGNKKPMHHGEPVSPGTFHYKLLIVHAWMCGLIFPLAGVYLIYLAITGNAV